MNTKIITIDPKNIDPDKIKQAAEIIRQGGIVAFPTETVYGLAADFFNPQAKERIFQVKKRPDHKPLTVQIADISQVGKFTDQIPDLADQWMKKFWPGPLTLVFLARRGLTQTAEKTIGLRIPENKIALEMIKQSRTAIVAPSANLSGQPAAQTAAAALNYFNGQIEMIIDGGKTEIGMASTVIDVTVSPYRILREGIIGRKDLENV